MLLLFLILNAQSQKPNLTKPVTQAEAQKVLSEVRTNLSHVLLHNVTFTNVFTSTSNSTNIRADLVHEVYLIFRATKPYFKLEPRTQYCDPKIVHLPDRERNEAIQLIKWGMLPPSSPVVTAKSDRLLVNEFGFTLGYFLNRIASCTHLPDPQWTPKLEKQ